MKFLILQTLVFSILFSSGVFGQKFLEGNFLFSGKKESYITLTDGKEIVGFIDDIDRKKGLIEEITIKEKSTKKKLKLKPEEIKHMYICPSGYDKMNAELSKIYDVPKWTSESTLNEGYIKEGYSYFESTEVMIKKKKMTLLLQLLNPGFSKGMKVFFDPYASETTSLAVGGFRLVGGDAKSYYFKKGDDVAFRLYKKNYDDEWKNLYGNCPKLMSAFKDKMGWSSIENHVYYYSNTCD